MHVIFKGVLYTPAFSANNIVWIVLDWAVLAVDDGKKLNIVAVAS